MATVRVHDRADEFRIELVGWFSGDSVAEINEAWKKALKETGPRQFTVDISELSGYDAAGRLLLHDMHKHGTQIAAGTPQSLVFLSEISAPVRRGPALVREAVPRTKANAKPSTTSAEPAAPVVLRARASGE